MRGNDNAQRAFACRRRGNAACAWTGLYASVVVAIAGLGSALLHASLAGIQAICANAHLARAHQGGYTALYGIVVQLGLFSFIASDMIQR